MSAIRACKRPQSPAHSTMTRLQARSAKLQVPIQVWRNAKSISLHRLFSPSSFAKPARVGGLIRGCIGASARRRSVCHRGTSDCLQQKLGKQQRDVYPAGLGKTWFKHHLYKERVIMTGGLNMFKPLGGPTLLSSAHICETLRSGRHPMGRNAPPSFPRTAKGHSSPAPLFKQAPWSANTGKMVPPATHCRRKQQNRVREITRGNRVERREKGSEYRGWHMHRGKLHVLSRQQAASSYFMRKKWTHRYLKFSS